jgi:hypothetical protein
MEFIKMRVFRNIFICTFIALCVILEADALFPQQRYSTFKSTVVAIQGDFRKWLDVKSNQDGLIVNFRIGRNRVYTPLDTFIPGRR